MDQLFPDGVNLNVENFVLLAEQATTSSAEQEIANQILTEYKSLENSWLNLDIILEQTDSLNAKFIALLIFKDGVQKRWDSISDELHEHYKQFFFNSTINWCNEKVDSRLISEANRCLVEILKNIWPEQWPSFIHDYIAASKVSMESCINCLFVLSELSDDAIDNISLTSERTVELQTALSNDVELVISHAEDVLTSGVPQAALQAMKTISHFLRWMELSDIFESGIIPAMLELIKDESLRDSALECLGAIPEHSSATASDAMSDLFDSVVSAVNDIGGVETCNSQALAETLSDFLTVDGCSLLQGQMLGAPTLSIQWVLSIFVTNPDATRICTDCLADLCCYFFNCRSIVQPIPELIITMFTVLINHMESPPDFPPKEMSTPEIYENLKTSVVVLANLHKAEAAQILLQQVMEAEDIDQLMKICWSLGAVSRIFTTEIESKIAPPIMEFLEKEIDNGAVNDVAALYCYVSSHFSRYLYKNWEQLHNFIVRLISFLQEENPYLQEAAVDAISLISNTCWKELISPHGPETSFVQNLTELSSSLCTILPSELVPDLYEALAKLITKVSDSSKGPLIAQMLVTPVELWSQAIENLTDYTDILLPIAVFSKVILISDTAFYPEVEDVIERCVQFFSHLTQNEDDGVINVRAKILELVKAYFIYHYDCKSVPSIIETVVTDYMSAPFHLKLPQSLDCFTTILNKLKDNPPFDDSFIADIVIPTKEIVEMPSPDLAASYAKLLSQLLGCEFVRESEHFGELLELLMILVKRSEEYVSRRALAGLLNLLNDTTSNEALSQLVLPNYAKDILQDLISTVMDRVHLFVFSNLTQALKLLMICNPDKEEVSDAIVERILQDYPYVTQENALNFAQTLCESLTNESEFKNVLKNFIISLRKTSSKARAMYSQIDPETLGLEGHEEDRHGDENDDPFLPQEF